MPTPKSLRQVREFPGTAGFSCLGILGFAELAKPLYEATKGTRDFQWTEIHLKAFENLKRCLLDAPALGLPDATKPFTLFLDEHKGINKGVLTQNLGLWKWSVAYLSKKLDPGAA